MRNRILLSLLWLLLSCNNKESQLKTEGLKKDKTTETEILPESKGKLIYNPLNDDWRNVLINDYIKNSTNELIRVNLEQNSRIEWFLDQTSKNDSTTFFIYNIGVEVKEEDGSEPRFSSCKWVYLDSVHRKLYEYDLPNDTILEWKRSK